jgi:hypothetical protein
MTLVPVEDAFRPSAISPIDLLDHMVIRLSSLVNK